MNRDKFIFRTVGITMAVSTIIWLGCISAIATVAWHFISKYW